MSKEEGGDFNKESSGDEEQWPTKGTITSRGFSGAPKFSDFRRTVISTNTATSNPPPSLSSDTKENKDAKPITKSRGLDEDGHLYFTKPSNYYTETREEEVEIKVDEDGILKKVFDTISKEEITRIAHNVTGDVKDFFERSTKGDHDT